jgi:ABC-type antimicrobial peptide transport system permease subunit
MDFAEELWIAIFSFLLGLPLGLMMTGIALFCGESLPVMVASLSG